MTRKTSVTLPDDLWNAWRASGLHLADLIRRGLDRPGDTARHERTETRLTAHDTILAMYAARLDQLRAEVDDLRAQLARPVPDDGYTAYDPAEYQRQQDTGHRELARISYTRLVHATAPDATGTRYVTRSTAAEVLGCGANSAGDRLGMLTAFGYAHRAEPLGNTRRWTLADPSKVDDGQQQNGQTPA